jgi:hypothetical protein
MLMLAAAALKTVVLGSSLKRGYGLDDDESALLAGTMD